MILVKIFESTIRCTSFILFSGQAAVITPRQVTSGLGSRRVKTIAAAKHHTVLATEGGEVFTWGSNRGKLYFMYRLYMTINFFLDNICDCLKFG